MPSIAKPDFAGRPNNGNSPKGRAMPISEKKALSRKYKRNYLKAVLVRIDFAAPVEIGAHGPPKVVIDSLKKAFPIPEAKKATVLRVISTLHGTQRTEAEQSEWFYHSRKRDRRVFIDDNAMFLECDRYTCFEDLRDQFMAVAQALFKGFPDLQVKRLGVRYVDNIELQEADYTEWGKYLSDDLLAPLRLADDRKTIARAFNVLEWRLGEDLQCRFQYGMPNPDYPSLIRKKLFVLDWDVFCVRLLDAGELPALLDEFHRVAKLGFERVIKDGLRSKMGVIRAT
jgi:uncharacterized protein (TIGR04255 family)